jgi:hypothetical protein
MSDARASILAALRRFVAQRPGLEFGNYGDVSAYRTEVRRITKQRHDAETLLAYVERSGMSADTLRSGFRAFAGRLTLTETPDGATLDYCTGQYFPTEYREAACCVLVSALWNYWYADHQDRVGGHLGARDHIQRAARRAFRERSIRERFA